MKSYCKKYLLFLILLLTFSISGCGEEEQLKVTDTRFSMDTFVKIDAYSDKPGEARLAIDDAMQTFQKTAQVTDRFNDGGPGSLYEANSKAAATSGSWPAARTDCPLRKNYRNPYAIQVKTNIILTLPHKH